MTVTASITEAKAQLSKLVEAAERGETVIIQRGGRSVAVLRGVTHAGERRQLGGWKGRVRISDDFDELPDDVAAALGML